MCGIVGYIGNTNAKDSIIFGLKKLEYRGYDSSGIALLNDNKIEVYKKVGRVASLEEHLDEEVDGNIGIAHTRWATHGIPSDNNSHPHKSMNDVLTIVHNGVIENYISLKDMLVSEGYTFISDTDTEVVANLLEFEYLKDNDFERALTTCMKLLEGSYALGIILDNKVDTIYCAKNKAPMLAGLGEGFNMIGSDVMAMLHETSHFYEIHDLEYLVITKDQITIKDINSQELTRNSFQSKINSEDVNLQAYDYYMEKEIDEQPAVLRNMLAHYFDNDTLKIDQDIIDEIRIADRIYIIASGTSYNAGLIAQQLFKKLAYKPVEVHMGSEFGYDLPIISDRPLFVFITQSGETADSRVALKAIKALNYKSLTITNVEGSTLAREADYHLLLHAGPEIAVASTKAYVAQSALLAILANAIALKPIDIKLELSKVANSIEDVISRQYLIEDMVAKKIVHSRNCFYIGRLEDYAVSIEAALKLKEVSYIQTEGFAAAELKHGTIALIEDGTPVIALISNAEVALNTRSSLQEVIARQACASVIVTKSLAIEGDDFVIEDVHPYLNPLTMVVATQLVAFYAAKQKGLDIDKPRNLAKSVTVE